MLTLAPWKGGKARLVTRLLFELYRDRTGITDIQRAAQFLYALTFSFSGGGETFPVTRVRGAGSISDLRQRAELVKQRLQSVTIEHLDWEQAIERYDGPDTFFFCDPPYMETSGYRAQFVDRDQEALAARLKSIKGKFLMTNSDLPAVRQLYRGFPMTVLRGQLSIERSHSRALKHLTVANYPLKRTT